jgi:Repeat of unknown function (DUF5650)/Secretion system C-terminal sorting domain
MSTLKLIFLLLFAAQLQAQTIHITGPAGSGLFGETVTVLTNGNYVVADPSYDEGSIVNVGAVYLYNGSSHTLISTLKGSMAGDSIGSNGIVALSNGNFIVRSPYWDNGGASNVGAITWCSGSLGLSGIISSSNSLVGSKANDVTGNNVIEISNGNYMAICPNWDNGAIADAGAAIWGNGSTGISGVISSGNALVGGSAGDFLNYTIILLGNGNYLIKNPNWNNGTATDAGALTWYSGSLGLSGFISSSNSLVGGSAGDFLSNVIILLGNGNYLVKNPNWNNGTATDAGALTWCNGSSGLSGIISSSNSLVGSSVGDFQNNTVNILGNGNYVVNNPYWSNIAGSSDAGAVTWGNGSTGITGTISSANSLVGSFHTGGDGIAVLSNGNYVVSSPEWYNGALQNVGAATWANGLTGITGMINVGNSLVGSKANDEVGKVRTLNNGNYVVYSRGWDNGSVVDAGAATFVNGNVGLTGVVNSSNSLVGSTANDRVGYYGVTDLGNSNYIVHSPFWTNGTATGAGAITWGRGTTGITGAVNSSNSLVGNAVNSYIGLANFLPGLTVLSNGNYVVCSTGWNGSAGAVTWGNGTIGVSGVVDSTNSLVGGFQELLGYFGITALNNGNYLVYSPAWDNGTATDAGAVTWGNGTTGISGKINSGNSLVGSNVNDNVGASSAIQLSNGNYLVKSPIWDNGTIMDAGAITWGSGSSGVVGVIGSNNSLVGSTANDNIGSSDVTVLTNGNYLVNSPYWDNGTATDAGAVTWGSGSTGVVGVIGSGNSLVGNTANNNIGSNGVTILTNGNYLVKSPAWDNGSATDAGAITWGNGTIGISGIVSNSNSLVGSTTNDSIGSTEASTLSNGDYLVYTPNWDNGITSDAGAVSWGNGSIGLSGIITSCNSVMGTAASGGASWTYSFNSFYDYLMVGRPSDNIVSIYMPAGMSLAITQDSITTNINDNAVTPLIASTACRIIAFVAPNGTNPMNGLVNAKAWVEPSLPTFGGDPFVARHYEITPVTNPSTATAKVTLFFAQQEFDDFNNHAGSILNLPTDGADVAGKANLRIGKYTGTSSDGSGLPDSYAGNPVIIDPNDADIVWNSGLTRWEVSFEVTGFSGFIVQTKATPIPLQLLNFSAVLVQNDVLVSWKTTNEINTKNFEVERSPDGSNFTKLGSIAAINSGNEHFYHYNDTGAAFLSYSKLHYRLKQVDNDGRYSYSPIVLVHLSRGNSVTFYPNPVSNIVTLRFSNKGLINTQAVLTDIQGKQVTRLGITNYQQQIDLGHLPSGTYLLKLADGTTVKLMKE